MAGELAAAERWAPPPQPCGIIAGSGGWEWFNPESLLARTLGALPGQRGSQLCLDVLTRPSHAGHAWWQLNNTRHLSSLVCMAIDGCLVSPQASMMARWL
jgi:hypothetical protein